MITVSSRRFLQQNKNAEKDVQQTSGCIIDDGSTKESPMDIFLHGKGRPIVQGTKEMPTCCLHVKRKEELFRRPWAISKLLGTEALRWREWWRSPMTRSGRFVS